MRLSFKLISGQEIVHDTQKELIIVGRSPHCDIVVPFEGFSRKHCQIEISKESKVFLTDLDSANGISIDGEKIEPETKTEYNLLLPLVIGPAEVSIELDPAQDTIYKNVGSFGTQKANPAPISRNTVVSNPSTKPKKSKPRNKNVSSVLVIVFVVIGFFIFQEVKSFLDGGESEEDELSRLQFESQMKSKKNDGSVKTKDF